MYATVRRYEGIDKARILPALRKLPGFSGCYVFDDGEALPNTPKITAVPVIAHEVRRAAVANGVPALA
jgi:hypothetical protein